MSVTKKTYTIGSVQQLIDLNGDTVNFDITFKVSSKKGETFEVLVVDQKTLDKGEGIEYKKVNGDISGNIVQDKNIHDHYYLILKCNKPCEVDVEITKKEIAANVPPQPPPPQYRQPQPRPISSQENFKEKNVPSNSGSTIKYVIIGIVIIGGICLLYYFYRQKQKTDASSTSVLNFGGNSNKYTNFRKSPSPVHHSSPVSSQHSSPSSSHHSSPLVYNVPSSNKSMSSKGYGGSNSLFSRLQSVRI